MEFYLCFHGGADMPRCNNSLLNSLTCIACAIQGCIIINNMVMLVVESVGSQGN